MHESAQQSGTAAERVTSGRMRIDKPRLLALGTFLVPMLVSAVMSFWKITVPSYWIDEAATLSAARRSVPQIFHLIGNTDVVHGTYYLMVHFWIQLFGGSELGTRSLSAVALIVATPGVVLIGTRIAGRLGGFAAGLVFALSPVAAIFAANARSGAVVIAATVWATVALFRALERRTWLRWVTYALLVAFTGYVNLFALTILPAHLILLLTRTPEARVNTRRSDLVRWLAACVVAGVALIPLVLKAEHQQGQIGYLSKPDSTTVPNAISFLSGGGHLVPLIVVLAACGILTVPRGYRWFMGAWAVGPGAILISVSLLHPVYVNHYILGALPAVTAIAGLTIAWIAHHGRIPGRIVAVVLASAVVVLAWRQLSVDRVETLHPDDLRVAAACIQANEQPGDAILHLDGISRWATAAYPGPYKGLYDLKQADGGSPVESGSLRGLDADNSTVLYRLLDYNRMWVMFDMIGKPAQHALIAPLLDPLHLAGWRATMTCHFQAGSEVLWVRHKA